MLDDGLLRHWFSHAYGIDGTDCMSAVVGLHVFPLIGISIVETMHGPHQFWGLVLCVCVTLYNGGFISRWRQQDNSSLSFGEHNAHAVS